MLFTQNTNLDMFKLTDTVFLWPLNIFILSMVSGFRM